MSSYLFNLIGGNPFAIPFSNDPYTWSNLAVQANTSASYFCFPSLINDGSSITMNPAGNISLISASGATTWTKAPTAVNGSAGSWVPSLWVDNVDSPNDVWGLAVASTTVYLFKIAIATGTLTTIGSAALTNFSNGCFFERAAMGSGNFTLYFTNSGGAMNQVTLNAATGAIVGSITAVSQNSQTWPSSFNAITYVSADGTVLVGTPYISTSPGSAGSGSIGVLLPISRNGHFSAVPISAFYGAPSAIESSYGTGFPATVAGNVVVSQWLTNWVSGGSIAARSFPVLLRTTLDAWLKQALSAVQTQ